MKGSNTIRRILGFLAGPFCYAAVIMAILAAGGCTQNNGHIGCLFGSWVLQSVVLNGEPTALPEETETYWSFQSDVLRVTLEKEHLYYELRYATFIQMPDNILRVDFTHSENGIPAGTGAYSAPEWMGFPAFGVFDLAVAVDGPNDRLILTYVKSDSEVYVYSFARTW